MEILQGSVVNCDESKKQVLCQLYLVFCALCVSVWHSCWLTELESWFLVQSCRPCDLWCYFWFYAVDSCAAVVLWMHCIYVPITILLYAV